MINYLNDQSLRQLFQNHKPDEFVFIDIREPFEYEAQHIASSINVPLNQINLHPFSNTDKAAIFYCKSGMRSRSAEGAITKTGFKDIYCLEGGIEQWQRCGFTVEPKSAPKIGIMRQVQMTAGALVLVASILAATVSFIFIWAAAFIGAGLILAGMTGYCGMAKLLARMPWNKHSGPPACTINQENFHD